MVRRLRTIAALAVVAVLGNGAATASAGSAGQPDPSFGGGTVIAPPGVRLLGAAAQADGSVVAVGTDGQRARIAQFTPGGALRSSFAAAGNIARAVIMQPDGKFVVVGGGDGDGIVVERFTFSPDGSLTPDLSFGSGGVVTVLSGDQYARGNAIALQGNQIVVAGSGTIATGPRQGYPGLALARLTSKGIPDHGFASTGVEVVDLGRYSAANGLAVQSDGKLVIAGSVRDDLRTTSVLAARFNPDGSLDPSFNGTGASFCGAWVCIQYASGAGFSAANGLTLQPDGKVVLAGSASNGATGSDALVVRLNSRGVPDTSFGSGGAVELPATTSRDQFTQQGAFPGALAVTAEAGKIVAVGYYDDLTIKTVALWALNGDGTLDQSFGSGGRTLGAGGQANAVAPAPGGNLVVAGETSGSGLAARYFAPLPAGTPPPPSGTPLPPFATTGRARLVTELSATITGQINPNGLATSYYVDYGRTRAYGFRSSGASAFGSTAAPVSVTLTRLRVGTSYHYRLVATNSAGVAAGRDMTFKTLPPLSASVRRLAASYNLATLARKGLLVRVGCSQACQIRGSLLLAAASAKRLGLSSRQVALASASASLRRSGSVRLRLSLTKAVQRGLRRRRKTTLTLRIVTSPAGGGPPIRFNRTVAIYR